MVTQGKFPAPTCGVGVDALCTDETLDTKTEYGKK
jgi:hypothetical protein